MNPTIAWTIAILLGLATIAAVWYRGRRSRKCTPDGMPRPGTEWESWDKKKYEISTPVTNQDGKPVNPVIRKGAFSAVIPRKQFHRLMKP